jgi:hypothetical protein
VWPELKEQIAVEQNQLQQLLELHQPLLQECRSKEPGVIELSALASLLHSFYTGIENMFRRVAIELDGGAIQGEAWHRRLLQQMVESQENRPQVISSELYERLRPYLQFRHVFRGAYSFQLQWEKMAPLVLDCEETLAVLRSEIASFSSFMDERQNS